MKLLSAIFKRQFAHYASAPGTYVSVAIFSVTSVTLGLHMSPWPAQDNSHLQIFFQLHPWLYLLLIPLLAAQLWSDESNSGFLDLMKTLPITPFEWVVGKFLAAWVVVGIALILTFPLVIITNYLGKADNSVIASQFVSSWLLAGSYLSVGCFMFTLVRQRTALFILTVALLLVVSGLSYLLDALEHQAPIWAVDSLVSLNPFSRYSAIDNGKLALRDTLYFISTILTFLAATTVTLNYKHS
ncbi:heme exporter protein CcmB [Pseudomonas fluorescens]|uniref:heme exporter protein CcmB n=1 Tax=Pseudomonas fluorescens TaxID=294 RepID=UPI00177B6E92|nr:heme exporter protein CcmB [Pseudomonas fluorescens]MBD8239327.1 heme exporter protein CcmB [Pseudomonas fluorescens]MDY0897918.1 heme exporter protein CcmB [Pseudomonas fluorescens]